MGMTSSCFGHQILVWNEWLLFVSPHTVDHSRTTLHIIMIYELSVIVLVHLDLH